MMSRSMPSSSEIVPLSAIDESGNTVEPLSAQDQLFLMCEKPTTAMHVGILLVLEKGLPERRGGVDIDRLRQHVSARLESLPRYRKRIAYTPLRKIPVWVEDNFDIAFHVRHVALPTPRTDTALKVLCGELLAQPLHPAKPLWELHIIEGLRGGRTGVLAKAHHCLVDGVRGAHVLEVLLDIVQHAAEEEAEARRLRAVPRRRPRPALATEPRDLNRELLRWEAGEIWSSLAGVAGAVREMVRQPRQTLLRAVDAAADLSEVLRAGSAPAAASAINGSNSAGRRFDWLEMELDQIKAIKNRLGGTVNDVVLAIVTGGLRRFLIEQRGVRWPKDLRALVPVNRRSAGEGLTCGNFIAGMMVDLPISAVDPMWRYRVVCNRAAAAKHSRQAAGAELLTSAGSALLGVGLELIDWVRPFNLVVSNIPGPQIPLYFAGAPLTAMYPVVPLFTGQGASVALFSYAGKLCWGFHTDSEIVPDLAQLSGAIEASYEELRRICGLQAEEPRRAPIARRRRFHAGAATPPVEIAAAALR